jgi:Flp pilus assembly protein TadD
MGFVGRLNRIGMEACRRGQFDEAELNLLAALELAQTRGGGCTSIKIHNNLGIVCELQGRHEKAAYHYGNALDLLKEKVPGNHPLHERLTRSLTRAASAGSTAG